MAPAKPRVSHRASWDPLKGPAQHPQQLAGAPGLKGSAGGEPRPKAEDNKLAPGLELPGPEEEGQPWQAESGATREA